MLSTMIRMLREELGLSQEQLAEKLKVSRQSVTKWESGNGLPDVNSVVRLAQCFNVTVDELLEVNSNGKGVKERWNKPLYIYSYPRERPCYTLAYKGKGCVFSKWQEFDACNYLHEVGDEASYASYYAPDWELIRTVELRATRKAWHEGVEGIWIEKDVFLADGYHLSRRSTFLAKVGDAAIPINLAVEKPVGERLWLYRPQATEVRRIPQKTWTASPDKTTCSLMSTSPEYQYPDLVSWGTGEIEIGDEVMCAMGLAGVFDVTVENVTHECSRLIHCGFQNTSYQKREPWLVEYYIDKRGRTLLKRVFDCDDVTPRSVSMEIGRQASITDEERMTLNGITLYHLEDAIRSCALPNH